MFYDNSEIMYENPPPPTEDFEYDFEPPVFVFPSEARGVNSIEIDPSIAYLEIIEISEEYEENLNEIIKKYKSIKAAENLKNIEDAEKVKYNKIGETVKIMIGDACVKSTKSSKSVKSTKSNECVKSTKSSECVKSTKSSECVKNTKEHKYAKNRNMSKYSKSRKESGYTSSDDSEYATSTDDSEYTKSSTDREYAKSRKYSEYTKRRDSDYSKRRDSDYSKRRDSDYSKRRDSDYSKRRDSDYSKRRDSDYSKRRHSDYSKRGDSDYSKRRHSDYSKSKKNKEYAKSSKDSEYSTSTDDSNYSTSTDDSKYAKSRKDSACAKSRKESRYAKSAKEYEYANPPKDREYEYATSVKDSKNVETTRIRRIVEEEIIEVENQTENLEGTLDLYHCNVCNLELKTSDFNSHMMGKRHKKAAKLLHMQTFELTGLDVMGFETFPIQSGRERIQLHDVESKMQKICDSSNLLILGLDDIIELRGYEEVKYACDLCSATCFPIQLIDHITGFRHQMSCLEKYYPKMHAQVKNRKDKKTVQEIKLRLKNVQMEVGRGKIKVFKDVIKNQTQFEPSYPSTSRAEPYVQLEKSEENSDLKDKLKVTDEKFLSRDFGDFYCTLCDSHMNNYLIWENHVTGKRHGKNKKMQSEGFPLANSSHYANPDAISHLEENLVDCNDIIVGLNFIRENQTENGDCYNCFLCGSTCSSKEIMDHLNQMKHKEKYLEKLLVQGHDNSINKIKEIDVGKAAKEALIDGECLNMLAKHGRGKPIICEVKI